MVELDDPALLPDEVAAQARAGDGWVKLVGDWIYRGVGDLAPIWPDDVLASAIEAAHAEGAEVTAHVFGTDALPGLLAAGIDCIEHGTGLTTDLVDEMAVRGIALVPTLINVANFPTRASRARPPSTRPTRATCAKLYAGAAAVVRRAAEAGVLDLCRHRRRRRHRARPDRGRGSTRCTRSELSTADALGAASWAARDWLGRPGLDAGAPADLVVYRGDPRADLAVLREPELIVLRGRPWRQPRQEQPL